MKLYLAGPMSGYPGFNYPAFESARVLLNRAGHDVLCPTDSENHNDTGSPQTWDWYMRHALAMVLKAEGVALLDGWEASRGARLEVEVAHALGLSTVPLRTVLLESQGSCQRLAPETNHEDEGYSCSTHNMPWDECPQRRSQGSGS